MPPVFCLQQWRSRNGRGSNFSGRGDSRTRPHLESRLKYTQSERESIETPTNGRPNRNEAMIVQIPATSFTFLAVLTQLIVSGCVSERGRQHSDARSTQAACPGGMVPEKPRRAFVTGSTIPQPVDSDGRPTESTTSVQIIDQKTVNLVGGGSAIETLSKLPYASRTPR